MGYRTVPLRVTLAPDCARASQAVGDAVRGCETVCGGVEDMLRALEARERGSAALLLAPSSRLQDGHPLERVVPCVGAEHPRVGDGAVGLHAECVLVRGVGGVVQEGALHQVAELKLSQLGGHVLILELAQRVVGHKRDVHPVEELVVLALLALLLAAFFFGRAVGNVRAGPRRAHRRLLLLFPAREREGAREGRDRLLHRVGARKLFVRDLLRLEHLYAALHPLRLDEARASADRLAAETLHLGQPHPLLQLLDPVLGDLLLGRAQLPVALWRLQRDAVLRAFGLANPAAHAHRLVQRDLHALLWRRGGVARRVVVGELPRAHLRAVLPRLGDDLEDEPPPLPRLARAHARLLLRLLENPAGADRLLRLGHRLLLLHVARHNAVHVERREQLAHLRLPHGTHADVGAVDCVELNAPLVKLHALRSRGGEHVRDGEGDDRLRKLALALLLLGEHGELRVLEHKPVAHPHLLACRLLLLRQVEPALRQHQIHRLLHRLLRRLRGV
mmetsp:Transcript_6647/g.16134  ORF Transcript_6647/g.16134 Transcript_6647/m.16134 type:complete len:504 (+) Transcript_6647:441-1952(+)